MTQSIHETAVGNHPLNEEQRKALREGGLANDFLHSETWPMLEGQQEAECYEALQALYECESSDPSVVFGFWRKWKSLEKYRQKFKNHLEALAQDYNELIERVQQSSAPDELSVPTGAESQEADPASI